jgi:hypothetical protein
VSRCPRSRALGAGSSASNRASSAARLSSGRWRNVPGGVAHGGRGRVRRAPGIRAAVLATCFLSDQGQLAPRLRQGGTSGEAGRESARSLAGGRLGWHWRRRGRCCRGGCCRSGRRGGGVESRVEADRGQVGDDDSHDDQRFGSHAALADQQRREHHRRERKSQYGRHARAQPTPTAGVSANPGRCEAGCRRRRR